MNRNPVYVAAVEAWEAGLSVLPVRENGTKAPTCLPVPVACDHVDCIEEQIAAVVEGRPAMGWRHHQHSRLSRSDFVPTFGRAQGLGVVTGAVSGNLTMLESETAEHADRLRAAARGAGCGDVMEMLDTGYRERTPGGGVHWLLSLDIDTPKPGEALKGGQVLLAGNEKLASRPKRPDEMKHANDKVQVLIETRAEGGFTVVAPSCGRVHPTGRPYVREVGSFATIPVITMAQWLALRDAAMSLDEMPKATPRKVKTAKKRDVSNSTVSPMERFNTETTWSGLLAPRGWTYLGPFGNGKQGDERSAWCRPGKTPLGVSATTIDDGPMFVFSTSAGLTPHEGLSKFAVYAELEHRGDCTAAAVALLKQRGAE